MVPLILLDLDGVLADLDKHIVDVIGDPRITDAEYRSELFNKHLPYYVNVGGFEAQPMLPNAKKLVKNLLNIQKQGFIKLSICTSVGSFYKPNSEVMFQKKNWLMYRFPELTETPIIFTTSGVDKSFYAHEYSMLIDDHENNISRFINNGGKGFLYTNDLVDISLYEVAKFSGMLSFTVED